MLERIRIKMGRKGSKMHLWSDKDEESLLHAIETCKPLMDHYVQQTGNKSAWWDSVAGRLLPDICVTGAACKRRFEIIDERNKQANESDKQTDQAWIDVATKVYEYERDLQEAALDDLNYLKRKTGKIEVIVKALWKELTGLDEVTGHAD
jgi:hypothetical protein